MSSQTWSRRVIVSTGRFSVTKTERDRVANIHQEITFCNRKFRTEFNYDPKIDCWHVWVYFQGTEEESKSFMFLTCVRGRSVIPSISYKAKVISMDVKKQDVIDNEMVMPICDAQLQKFQVNGMCNFYVELYSKIPHNDVQ
jgi:hypothetical protein